MGEEETSSPEADLLSDDDERGARVDRTPSCKDCEGVDRDRDRERGDQDEYVLSVGRLNEEG